MGVFALFLASTTNYGIALATLAVIGFGGGFMAVPLNAYLQDEPAADEKGRMIATNNLMNSVAMMVAYGMLEVMHDLLHWNPRIIFGALGLAMLFGAVVVTRVMPAFVVRFVLAVAVNVMFRIKVLGAQNIPKSGAALLVSNHVSYADAMLAGYATHRFIRFLMWKPIYEVRVARPFFELLKAIPIDNGSPKATVRALRAAHDGIMEAGSWWAFSPKGRSRWRSRTVWFAALWAVIRGIDCPIVPVRAITLRSWEVSQGLAGRAGPRFDPGIFGSARGLRCGWENR